MYLNYATGAGFQKYYFYRKQIGSTNSVIILRLYVVEYYNIFTFQYAYFVVKSFKYF